MFSNSDSFRSTSRARGSDTVARLLTVTSSGIAAHQALKIENQADAAIAENRASRDTLHVLKLLAQAFDDHLLFSDQFIDHHAEPLVAVFGNDEKTIARICGARLYMETVMQANNGKQRTTHQRHFGATLDSRDHLRSGPQHFTDR